MSPPLIVRCCWSDMPAHPVIVVKKAITMHVAIIRFIISLLVVVISCQLSAFSSQLFLCACCHFFTDSPTRRASRDEATARRAVALAQLVHRVPQILTPNPEPLPLLQRLAGNSGFQIGFYQGLPHNPYHRYFNIPGICRIIFIYLARNVIHLHTGHSFNSLCREIFHL